MDKEEALQKYRQIKHTGDKYFWEEDRYVISVMPIASRRRPPRNIEGETVVSMRHQVTHTKGFEVDIDFLDDEDKAKIWSDKMKVLNESVTLTLVYGCICAIRDEALEYQDARYSDSMPFTHDELVSHMDNLYDAMFAAVKGFVKNNIFLFVYI